MFFSSPLVKIGRLESMFLGDCSVCRVMALKTRDGKLDGAVYTWFDSLCNEANQSISGTLTEHNQLTSWKNICNQSLDDFCLIRVAVRRKDGQKRVYVERKA